VKLPAAVYSAYRGYAWSQIPTGIEPAEMDMFLRFVSDVRGDFPDPLSVETGLVCDGRLAAAFTWQNVASWDANGRASDYGAFVFFPVVVARLIDFVTLVSQDFFWTPTRTPEPYLDYVGGTAPDAPDGVLHRLECDGRTVLDDPRQLGALLTTAGTNSAGWTCLMQADGKLSIARMPHAI